MDTLEVYPDAVGKYRWRKKSEGNNEIISASGESFDSVRNAKDSAIRANPEFDFTQVTVVED